MSIIDTILSKSIIEYVPEATKFSDGSYRCACFLHGGDNPSALAFFPDTNKFYCFSCGAHGNIINLVMERDGCTFNQAVHKLCEDFGLTISEDDDYKKHLSITERNGQWIEIMRGNLDKIKDYLYKRGLTDETIDAYKLGYSEKTKSLAIPMFDAWNRPVAFLYRYFEGKVKYKNSKNVKNLFEKGEFLFGQPQAQQHLKTTRTLMLAEGAFDCMSAVQQGNCCLAYCGISITRHHIDSIKDILAPITGSKVVLCPDNDGRASKFVTRARDLFKRYAPKVVVKVAIIPDPYKDFNDMLIAGVDIATTVKYEHIDKYCVRQVLMESDDREVQEQAVVSYMKSVDNPIVRADIAEFLAATWQRDVGIIRELLSIKEDTTEEKLADIYTVDRAYAQLEQKRSVDTFGLGYPNIDKTIQLERKNVVVLGAYSYTGKTDNLIEWILYWCVGLKKKVLFFTMEMPVEDIMKIIVAKIVRIERFKVRDYIAEHPETYQMICDKLRKYLFIVDRNGLTLDAMEDYVRLMMARDNAPEVVCVDYFQYLANVNTNEEQDREARKMKAFAKNLDVTLIMLSQLRKASQAREADGKFHEPTQADLVGSGALGNSADYILLMWRPALNERLSPVDLEQQKYDTCVKITKAREVRNANLMYRLVYNPVTSRLTEKISDSEK